MYSYSLPHLHLMEKLIIATYSFQCEYYPINQRLICIPHPTTSLLLNKELRLPTPACLVSPSSEQKAKHLFSADLSFFQKQCCKPLCTEQNITQHFRIFLNYVRPQLRDCRTPILGKCFMYDIFTLPETAESTAEMKDSERE